jgi:6-phosphogluconolactonase/glucosamine-6-phosphate isomerase/deaminase
MTESSPRAGLRVVTTADIDALAQASADFVVSRVNEVLTQQAGFSLALSGGTTP